MQRGATQADAKRSTYAVGALKHLLAALRTGVCRAALLGARRVQDSRGNLGIRMCALHVLPQLLGIRRLEITLQAEG